MNTDQDYSRGDIGPLSAFVATMPKFRLLVGTCPSCFTTHIFMFIKGNRPQLGEDGNQFCIEPHHEDLNRPPLR